MLLLNLVLLCKLVLELSEVDNFTDWRSCIRNNLHQIRIPLTRQHNCIARRHNAKLSATVINYSDLDRTDVFVHANLFFADGCDSFVVIILNPERLSAKGLSLLIYAKVIRLCLDHFSGLPDEVMFRIT